MPAPTPASPPPLHARLAAALDAELTDPAWAEIARALVRRAVMGDVAALGMILRNGAGGVGGSLAEIDEETC